MLQRWDVSNYHFGSGVVVLIGWSFVYVVVLWRCFWLFRRLCSRTMLQRWKVLNCYFGSGVVVLRFGWLMLVLLMIEKIFYVVVWWWFFDGLEDCVLEQCGKGEDRIKPSHWKCCFFCLRDGIAAIHQDLMLLLKFSSHFNKYHVQIAGGEIRVETPHSHFTNTCQSRPFMRNLKILTGWKIVILLSRDSSVLFDTFTLIVIIHK